VTNRDSSAAKDPDNYVWIATLIAVIFVVWLRQCCQLRGVAI
jgi:hypothetical protein